MGDALIEPSHMHAATFGIPKSDVKDQLPLLQEFVHTFGERILNACFPIHRKSRDQIKRIAFTHLKEFAGPKFAHLMINHHTLRSLLGLGDTTHPELERCFVRRGEPRHPNDVQLLQEVDAAWAAFHELPTTQQMASHIAHNISTILGIRGATRPRDRREVARLYLTTQSCGPQFAEFILRRPEICALVNAPQLNVR